MIRSSVLKGRLSSCVRLAIIVIKNVGDGAHFLMSEVRRLELLNTQGDFKQIVRSTQVQHSTPPPPPINFTVSPSSPVSPDDVASVLPIRKAINIVEASLHA